MQNLASKQPSGPEADLDRLIHDFVAQFAKVAQPSVANLKGNEFIR